MAEEEEEPPAPFTVNQPIKLLIGAAAAITATFIGSTLGDQGTLIGVGIGSVAGGTAAALYEHFVTKAHGLIHKVAWTRRRIMLAVSGGVGIAAFSCLAGFLLIGVIQASTGKTVHGAITGSHDYGNVLGHTSTTPPTPAATLTPTETATATVIPSPSVTVTQVPTVTAAPTVVAGTPTSVPSVTSAPTEAPTEVPVTVHASQVGGTAAP